MGGVPDCFNDDDWDDFQVYAVGILRSHLAKSIEDDILLCRTIVRLLLRLFRGIGRSGFSRIFADRRDHKSNREYESSVLDSLDCIGKEIGGSISQGLDV